MWVGIIYPSKGKGNAFYACIDPELKEKYRELIGNGTFQEEFENFLPDKL